MARLAFLAAIAFPAVAWSHPPTPGTQAYADLHDYADWIKGVARDDGQICCDIADAALVSTRMGPPDQNGERRWQVRFGAEDAARIGAPLEWIDVPDASIVHTEDVAALPIAWWYYGQLRCALFPARF